MLTLFSTCKPFRGRVAVSQRNAIESWVRLGRGCDVVLVGDDEGTAEVARALGARHVPEVERDEQRTPLLDSVFTAAEATARHDLVCYVNADIMLTSDFLDAVARLGDGPLLMVGRRWDLDLDGPWDFETPGWDARLRELARASGTQKDVRGGSDYFVFRRGQWPEVPPFAIGRTGFDLWLIHAARFHGFPVIDASACVTPVHQNHDYGHASGGWEEVWQGSAALRNRALMGGRFGAYDFLDATWLMTPHGLEPADTPAHRARRIERRLAAAETLNELGRYEDALDVTLADAPAFTTPETARRHARAALRALYALGRHNVAERLLDNVCARFPEPHVVYNLASVCEELGALDAAVVRFEAVLARAGNAPALRAGTLFHLASIAASKGETGKAAELAQACLDENPDHNAARTLQLNLMCDAGAVSAAYVEGLKRLGRPLLVENACRAARP